MLKPPIARGWSIFGLTVVLFLSGCSFVNIRDEVSFDERGKSLITSMLPHIEPDVTSAKWLLEAMGEPNTRIKDSDGVENWYYDYKEYRTKRTHIFLILNYKSEELVPRRLRLEIKNGKVVAMNQGVSAIEYSSEKSESSENDNSNNSVVFAPEVQTLKKPETVGSQSPEL